MKKQFSKFFISISSIDWGVFVAFILLNLIFALSYPYCRLLLADSVEQMDIFPHDYPPSAFFRISSLSWLTAEFILGAFIALWAALMIKKFAAWILSIPIQFVVFSLAWWLLFEVSLKSSIQVTVLIFISQVIGVFAGLLIRWLIRKRCVRTKTPKPWWAN